MKNTDINLIKSYFNLLKNLSSDAKLELIARRSTSMMDTKIAKVSSLNSLYGSFISNKSADELITEIKNARTFNRKREAL